MRVLTLATILARATSISTIRVPVVSAATEVAEEVAAVTTMKMAAGVATITGMIELALAEVAAGAVDVQAWINKLMRKF